MDPPTPQGKISKSGDRSALMWLGSFGDVGLFGRPSDFSKTGAGGGGGGNLATTPLSLFLFLATLLAKGVSDIQGKVVLSDVVKTVVHPPVTGRAENGA